MDSAPVGARLRRQLSDDLLASNEPHIGIVGPTAPKLPRAQVAMAKRKRGLDPKWRCSRGQVTQRMRIHEKTAWMLRSLLKG